MKFIRFEDRMKRTQERDCGEEAAILRNKGGLG